MRQAGILAAAGMHAVQHNRSRLAQDHDAFWQETGLCVALDESLGDGLDPGDIAREGLGALVLKPAMLGGLKRVERLMDRAGELDIPAVVSSVFESPVALHFYAKLVLAHGLEHHAHGLDTWRWLQLKQDTLPFVVDQGRQRICSLARAETRQQESSSHLVDPPSR